MVSLARQQFLAVAKNEEFGIINFVAIYYEKSASRKASLKKKTFPRRNLLKASNIKTLKASK